MRYFEYRTSLLFFVLASATWSLFGLLLQKYLFDEIDTLKGWTFGEIALLNAFYNLGFAFFIMLSWGSIHGRFRNAVRSGELDGFITKPFAHRLMITFGDFDITGFFHLIPATIIMIVALNETQIIATTYTILIALIYFIVGQYVLYSLAFLLYSTTFWLTTADQVRSFFWSIENQGKTPLEILPKTLRFLLLSLIPIGFTAYIPTKALLGEIPDYFIIVALLLSAILIFINKLVWNRGVRRYESVGS
jgi:ABC-2 type transport system permease protein